MCARRGWPIAQSRNSDVALVQVDTAELGRRGARSGSDPGTVTRAAASPRRTREEAPGRRATSPGGPVARPEPDRVADEAGGRLAARTEEDHERADAFFGREQPVAHAGRDRAQDPGVGVGRRAASWSARNAPASAARGRELGHAGERVRAGEQLGAVERPCEQVVERDAVGAGGRAPRRARSWGAGRRARWWRRSGPRRRPRTRGRRRPRGRAPRPRACGVRRARGRPLGGATCAPADRPWRASARWRRARSCRTTRARPRRRCRAGPTRFDEKSSTRPSASVTRSHVATRVSLRVGHPVHRSVGAEPGVEGHRVLDGRGIEQPARRGARGGHAIGTVGRRWARMHDMTSPPVPIVRGDDGVRRCWWGASTPDYAAYHDDEWGRPVTDDTRIFEKLCLEGFQSGLSWLTILRKREGFRAAFEGFDIPTGRAVHRARRHAAARRRGHRPPPGQDRGDDRQRARPRSRSRTRTARSPHCSGRSNRVAGPRRASWATSRPPPPSPPRCRRRSRGTGSDSSARPPSTRRCRRWAWSTTTWSAARRAGPCTTARAGCSCCGDPDRRRRRHRRVARCRGGPAGRRGRGGRPALRDHRAGPGGGALGRR